MLTVAGSKMHLLSMLVVIGLDRTPVQIKAVGTLKLVFGLSGTLDSREEIRGQTERSQ
jgi:hypothetical protein